MAELVGDDILSWEKEEEGTGMVSEGPGGRSYWRLRHQGRLAADGVRGSGICSPASAGTQTSEDAHVVGAKGTGKAGDVGGRELGAMGADGDREGSEDGDPEVERRWRKLGEARIGLAQVDVRLRVRLGVLSQR